MRRTTSASCAAALLLLVGVSIDAAATSQRTFVSVGGVDNPNCSIAAPCRQFTAAVTATSPNGEIIVLTSGGYGVVTIGKSLSIIAAPGVYAGITVFSGIGINVHGTGIVVALRGLTINGQGGTRGISFDLGTSLIIEDCEISNMTQAGIFAAASDGLTTIKNTVVRNNGIGIDGHGLFGDSGTTRVVVTNSVVVNNNLGALSDSNSGTAVQFTISKSTFAGNQTALEIINDNSSATFFLEQTAITFSSAAFEFQNDPLQAVFTAGNNSVGYVGSVIVGGGTLSPCCAL
jgi:hypothetical protein